VCSSTASLLKCGLKDKEIICAVSIIIIIIIIIIISQLQNLETLAAIASSGICANT
jgi:hypothetical protein